MRVLIVFASLAATMFVGGCSAEKDSGSDLVKPNPAMSNRYKQGASGAAPGAAPGGAQVPPPATTQGGAK